jgi:cob(I)alamin adenosyltransferase
MAFRIYTKTGDRGTTGLYGGGRVRKDDPRVEAYGSVDELNAVLGVAVATVTDDEIRAALRRIQDELFTLGGELATPDPDAVGKQLIPVGDEEIGRMERQIDRIDAEVPPLRKFVLPGGHPGAAYLHLARTVCRRAERRVLALTDHAPVREGVIVYLNRLSDLLFMLARLQSARAGVPEPTWEAPVKAK